MGFEPRYGYPYNGFRDRATFGPGNGTRFRYFEPIPRQRTAQSDMVKALQMALEARRQRIVVSQSSVGRVKWAGILLQGLCTLVAIAMVHSDNRLTCAIALTLFATGIALSLLLIAAYSRPFTGEISVGPDLLKQVMTSGATP